MFKAISEITKYSLTRRLATNQILTIRNLATSSHLCRQIKWSYLQGPRASPLMGITIGNLMRERAEEHPDRLAIAVRHQDTRFNFGQLLEESDKLAAGLLALGLKRGDRVGIWAPNCVEWLLTQYGTARAGIIMVNVNPAYRVSELEIALRQVGVKCIVASETFKTQKYYDMLHEICPELDNCPAGSLMSKRLPDLKSVVMISENEFPGALKFSDVMAAGNNNHRHTILDMQDKIQFDEPINIQFTSGTTGTPKGATLTHHNIVNNSRFLGERLEYNLNETRICIPVPLYHCFGMVIGSLQCLTHGATAIFPSPSFEPGAALQAVQEERCTSLYGTPTMFIDMLSLPNFSDFETKSLSTGVMAGSICPEEIMRQVIDKLHMERVTICYGTTENSPVTFQTLPTDPIEKRVSSIGIPATHTEIKVINSDGELVPTGEMGELCIRGYCTMLGYWNDPEKTKEVLKNTGWYHSGDLAMIDEEGYGYIVGRIKDMIIRGGENIYPAEIEEFLYKHPKVLDVQVIGIPDERMGEEVCAWIKLKEGEKSTEEEIKRFCKGKISHFKIPTVIKFVDEFPMTVSGKVKKFEMREAMKK